MTPQPDDRIERHHGFPPPRAMTPQPDEDFETLSEAIAQAVRHDRSNPGGKYDEAIRALSRIRSRMEEEKRVSGRRYRTVRAQHSRLEKAEAERDALRRDLEQNANTTGMVVRQLRARVEAGTRLLKKYGKHKNACSAYPALFEEGPCDCGLRAAITAAEDN